MSHSKTLRLLALIVVASLLTLVPTLCFAKSISLTVHEPTPEPVKFGLNDLVAALQSAGLDTDAPPARADIFARIGMQAYGKSDPVLSSLNVKIPDQPESFVIARKDKEIVVLAGDPNGLMYGLLELAERVRMDGQPALVLAKPIIDSPAVPFRAINPFLTLPVTEDEDWWFLSEDYWRGYLDMLARARINWLDIHGMYDFDTTMFPNIYPYIVKSETFPLAGVSQEKADRNLAMLNKVIGWAKDRGIKIALMSYSTSWDVPFAPKAPYEETEENLTIYTREVVKNTIKSCPDLAMIGFRIGESGMEEDFFRNSYIQGVAEGGREIPIYTRSWGAKKSKCMEIGEEFPGRLIVEIKYNGEQLGPPYHLQGGRMAGWRDYSYQDFLSYPMNYEVIWQIRANGTNRVFLWASPDLIRRTAESCTLAGSVGFCVEPMNAYYPAKHPVHKAGSDDLWYNWAYEREWFWHELWGRTAYSPDTPEKVWIAQFNKRFGKKGGETVYRLVKKMSDIVPLAFTFYAMGPDHRHHAPELEPGGSLADWADGYPFDTQNVQSIREYVDRAIRGDASARMTPLQAADLLEKTADETVELIAEAKLMGPEDNKELKCISADALALAHLGRYYAAKLRGAVNLVELEETGDMSKADAARRQASIASEMWRRLADLTDKHYEPFMEHLRHRDMKGPFHWTKWTASLAEDDKAIDRVVERLKSGEKPSASLPERQSSDTAGPRIHGVSAELKDVDIATKRLSVTASVEDESGVKAVYLKHKKLPSETQWKLAPMTKNGDKYTAEIVVRSTGAMYCIEALDVHDNGAMYPNFLEQTPYIIVRPWEAPIPPDVILGISLEDIASIDGSQYAALVAGRDADVLQAASPAAKQAILNLVEEGLNLIMFEQDFPQRFDLSWLPGGIRGTDDDFHSARLNHPHPLLEGLGRSISSEKVVNDALAGGDDQWIFLAEPKGLAIRKHGKGSIILSQMRILEGTTSPDCEMLVENMINYVQDGDSNKPLLIIDIGNDLMIPMLKNLDAPLVFLAE